MIRLHSHATSANFVGVCGGIFALFCLLALPIHLSIPLLLSLMAIIWTIIRPRVALYLLPIAVPWGSLYTREFAGISLNSTDMLVFLLAASWLMSYPLRQLVVKAKTGPADCDGFTPPRYLVFTIFIFLFTLLLSLSETSNLSLSLKEIGKWLEFMLVLLLGTQYIRTRRQIWTLVIIICLTAISQAFLGYVQAYFNLGPEAFVREGGSILRIYGTFGQPNPYAGYINMVLLLVIALTLLGHNPMLRILAGITTVLLTVALYLTQSRGGQIALIVTLLFIITVGIPCLRSLLVAGAIVVLGTLGAYCAGFVPERFIMPILKQLGLAGISLTAPTDNDFSTAERIAHWISGINMFLDHPFFGVGIGNYAVAYPHYFVTVFPEPLGHAHNYYINIAAEAGIFGLAGFLLFLLATFVAGGYSLQRVNQDLQQKLKLSSTLTNDRALVIGLLAALLSVCVHNMVDNLFVHSMTNLFALFLVMLLSLQKSDGHPGQARPLTKDAERTRLTAK